MEIGQAISHYRITAQLGRGGMGEVFEAQDLTLGRRVALKFLPPDLAKDTAALERFQLEARAASALNHPNICTIYAVENEAGQTFIAMELLEGRSLDAKLANGPLPIDRLLDLGIQLADALDAAHAKGIIHRDIKPANVFITPRGQVKVLDFGLAKLTRFAEPAMETVATLAGPGPAHLTSPGSTVGTIAYMSPEQASGEDLDARSDLFSAGAVLYQAATGALPFAGKTTALIFHAILQLDPPPPTQLNPSLPPKLDEIIAKALEKDRDLRYQSAADLRGDLRRLKRDLEASKSRTLSVAEIAIADDDRVSSGALARPATDSPSSSVVALARQSKVGFAVGAFLMLLLIFAASYGIYAFWLHSKTIPFQNISINKVTHNGKTTHAAISPDGKYVLSVMSESGEESLWLRDLPTDSDTQVIPPAQAHYTELRFSPDGEYLYFIRSEGENHELEFLYRAPLLGGTPQKLVTDIDSNVAFSPDGRQFAFVRDGNPDPGSYQIIVQSTDGGDQKVLSSGLTSSCLAGLAWSPDGKNLVCIAFQTAGALSALLLTDAGNGQKSIFFHSGGVLSDPVWLPNNLGILLLSRGISSSYTRNQIGLISYPDGKYRALTNDVNDYSDLSVTADGRNLTSVLRDYHWDVFLVPAAYAGDLAQVRQITSGDPVGGSLSWTADGQLIVSQDFGLDLVNPATGEKDSFPVEENAGAFAPSACPNGHYIVAMVGGHAGKKTEIIARVDAAGGNFKALTDGQADENPICSGDGKWVYYRDSAAGNRLMRVSIDGGASEKVSDQPVDKYFAVSPSGSLIAYATTRHTGDHVERLNLITADGSQPEKLLDFQHPSQGPLQFTPDGKAIAYAIRNHDVDNLWIQPLDGSPGRQITNFTGERIGDGFAWSPDGSKLVIIRGHVDSDVVLIRDAQP